MGLLQRIRQMTGVQAPQGAGLPKNNGPERRRHRRLQDAKLTIFIGNKRYKTNDWSLGGFRLRAPGNDFSTNQLISGALHGPGRFDRGVYEATIVWIADDGELGAHFIDISHQNFLAMSAAQV